MLESDEDSRSSNSSGSSNSSSETPIAENQNCENPNDLDKSESPSRNDGDEIAASKNEQEEEDIELSDIDDDNTINKETKQADISHEDLSDISDLESSNDVNSQDYSDLRHKLNKKRRQNGSNAPSRKSDEEELDFEGDEDIKDSPETLAKKKRENVETTNNESCGSVREDGEHKSEKGEIESGEELEDGEVTDGDDKRPEESEPKAVCRFFTRGQCTWGMSCRFLHPGTTDKGNYTMFELVRPMPSHPPPMIMPAYDYRTERPPLHHLPPHAAAAGRIAPLSATEPESAWERGLRTAKEMMRKANKRKELDIDFDEKKMNLSGPPDEIERDPYYHGEPDISPSFDRERVERRMPPRGGMGYSPPVSKFPRPGTSYYEEDQYGRMSRSYRELPAHRMPHYEDDDLSKRRTVRTATREVIVEKAEDWNDPWMRKGESGKDRKVRGRERSYSSNSSYSSSSSSTRSRSSSDSSRSPSPSTRMRGGPSRFERRQRSKERTHKLERPKSRSSSLKRRHSPLVRSRAGTNKKAPSPISAPKRKKPNSPPPRDFNRRKKRNSSSGSSSGSESESSYSSSTSSSNKKRRENVEKKVSSKKVETGKPAVRSPPPALKEQDEKFNEKAVAAAKLKSSRREELLKQLRAVEDAIARKRSKIV